ncbi:hypothetical protein FOC1_g10000517 [Fusarium oxysporum f. sp. cubense race 1]|uniref:Uncharacterized protein n=1 Tax=Fusarium oxysporum f. sp. cubense (strain race 1) TaxID=1229664 RepID=N4U854_FUSC1|nr:hypothetical protein FOC1_g10000517 [Fusarium oxysporum f. sp. cubense race 1]
MPRPLVPASAAASVPQPQSVVVKDEVAYNWTGDTIDALVEYHKKRHFVKPAIRRDELMSTEQDGKAR